MPEHPLDIIERYCGFYFTFFWEKGGERRRAEGRGGEGNLCILRKMKSILNFCKVLFFVYWKLGGWRITLFMQPNPKSSFFQCLFFFLLEKQCWTVINIYLILPLQSQLILYVHLFPTNSFKSSFAVTWAKALSLVKKTRQDLNLLLCTSSTQHFIALYWQYSIACWWSLKSIHNVCWNWKVS